MTTNLSPSECGVRKHHLCLTARFHILMTDTTDHYTTLVHPVLLCVILCHCYTVLCRITSGPFDQEVISSSLTLEDPDLKVRESTSLVSMATGLSSQNPAQCDKKCHSKNNTLFWYKQFFLRGHDLQSLCWYIFVCAGNFVLLHHTKKQEKEKEGMPWLFVWVWTEGSIVGCV